MRTMKRWILSALLLACVASAQNAVTFTAALRGASPDAKLVLISADGSIVGYSERLSSADLRVVLAEDFRGEALLLIAAPDGNVTHEFPARVEGDGAVIVDGRAMAESLADAGFGPPTFVTAGPPGDAPRGRDGLPDQAGGAQGLPPQAGGTPAEDARSGGGRGSDDGDEESEADDGGSSSGEGPPESAGPP
jgi:hypothetical protein